MDMINIFTVFILALFVGIEIISAPSIVDFLATSLAATTIAPLITPLPNIDNHAMCADCHRRYQTCLYLGQNLCIL